MNELRKVRLVGNDLSLNILERIFNCDDLTVFSENHCNQKIFYMTSTLFENLNKKELIETGNSLLKKVNAICCFVKGNYIPIKIEDVSIGERHYENIEEKIEVVDDLCIIENGKEKDLDENVIFEICSKIKNDQKLDEILLLLLEKGTDWVNLYRILDILDKDEDKKDLVAREWITDKDLKLLKRTANSPGAIGNEARHGRRPEYIPPPKPMSLNMAQILIKKIIWHYIKSLDE